MKNVISIKSCRLGAAACKLTLRQYLARLRKDGWRRVKDFRMGKLQVSLKGKFMVKIT